MTSALNLIQIIVYPGGTYRAWLRTPDWRYSTDTCDSMDEALTLLQQITQPHIPRKTFNQIPMQHIPYRPERGTMPIYCGPAPQVPLYFFFKPHVLEETTCHRWGIRVRTWLWLTRLQRQVTTSQEVQRSVPVLEAEPPFEHHPLNFLSRV